ncbi:MAG: hypothetical protein ACT4OE_02680 [Sphingosinicella sp.]
MRPLLAGVLLLAACGPEPQLPAASGNQLERLSQLENEEPEPVATATAEPLRHSDIALAPQPVCLFARGNFVLLHVSAAGAVVRLLGRAHHLPHAGPLAASGGFFDDGRIAVSVGRAGVAAGQSAPGAWPGRIGVHNRRTRARQEQDGRWLCGPGRPALPD